MASDADPEYAAPLRNLADLYREEGEFELALATDEDVVGFYKESVAETGYLAAVVQFLVEKIFSSTYHFAISYYIEAILDLLSYRIF